MKRNFQREKMKTIICILTVAMLAGCTTYWSRPNTSAQEANNDLYQCERESAYAYPTALAQTTAGAGYQSPAMTNCHAYGNNMNCTTMPGTYTPPPTITMDMNTRSRQQALSHCMMAKGYSAGRQPEQQSRIKHMNLQCYVQCKDKGNSPDTCSSECAE
jgi:hypothetical protein